MKIAPAILAGYVGTYKEQPRLWGVAPRMVEISLSGDVLSGELDGRGRVPLVAISETVFAGFNGLGLEFSPGSPPVLFVKHVSGDYRFERVR